MSYKGFASSIQRKEPAHAYWFEGDDASMKQLALDNLCQSYSGLYGSCTLLELDAASVNGVDIVEQVSQLTLSRSARVLLIAGAQQLQLAGNQELFGYLAKPLPDTCIVFDAAKGKRSCPVRQFLDKRGSVVNFPPPRERDVVGLINSWAEQGGKKIGLEAAHRLCERVGTDARLLRSEVEKLLLFAHPDMVIRPEHVDELCGETSEISIFKFTDAFKRKDLARCTHLLSKLLEQGKIPMYIETMLAREIRILLLLKQVQPSPNPREACAYVFSSRKSYTNFMIQQSKTYLEAAKSFDLGSLVQGYQALARADQMLKSTSIEPFVLLENVLVVSLY